MKSKIYQGIYFRHFLHPVMLCATLIGLAVACYYWSTEDSAFYVFWAFSIATAVIWPFIFGELQRTETDYIYYFLALLGVLGFFASESISSKKISSANRLSEYRKEASFYEEAIRLPEIFLARNDVKEIARLQLLDFFKQVSTELNEPYSDCPRDYADWDTEYCKNRRYAAESSASYVRRFQTKLFGVHYGRKNMNAQRILEIFYYERAGTENPGSKFISFDQVEPTFLRSSFIPLMDIYNYYTLPWRRKEDYESDPTQIVMTLEVLRELALENAIAEQKRFDELDDHGSITWIEIATANIWPYLLVMALTLKIARTRLQQSKKNGRLDGRVQKD